MTDARILTPDEVRLYWQICIRAGSRLTYLLNSHEALRSKLAEVEADRADIVARRDQVLADLRQSLEAEIAARKLVEAKLTVAEAELDLWQHCADCHERMDAPGHCSRAESESEVGYRVMWEQQIARAEFAEAALAKALEWRAALDELHVSNWVGVIDGLSPHEAVRKLLELALDQDRHRLTKERDEARAYADSQRSRADRAAQSLEHRTLVLGAEVKKREAAEAALARVRGVMDGAEACRKFDPTCSCQVCQLWLALRAALTSAAPEPRQPIRPHRFDCDACGLGIPVDEDGCCRSCGEEARIVTPEPPKGDPR